MYLKSSIKAECYGCTACWHACPTSAISFKNDEEGFAYPSIDTSKCINCGLCEKVCPNQHPLYNGSGEPSVFAAYIKNTKEREKSSSGGVFWVIAKYVIENGGYVYGATLDEHLKVKHIEVNTIEDLERLRGSKYVQSELNNIFPTIRKRLSDGSLCYFTGTGCQIAGLKSYLRKEYDNLITSDLVCHGVPSQWMFDQHIRYLEKRHNCKIENYQFRDNKRWRGCEIVSIRKPNGGNAVKYYPTYELSPFLYGFMHSFFSRYSCYSCQFARIPRQGDITLADYWGARDLFRNMNTREGVSLVLLNSSKGERIWNCIKDSIHFEVSNISDASIQNANLISSTTMNEQRRSIYNTVRERGYESIVSTILKSPSYNRIKLITFLQTSIVTKPLYELYSRFFAK